MRRARLAPLILPILAACLGFTHAALAGDPARPRLDGPDVPSVERSGSTSYRATGSDPAAPRQLVLWRWREGRFERLASTRSDPDGRFDFGEQPLPSSSVWLHVCARGERPDADRLLHVERAVAAPVVAATGPIGNEILLLPSERGGELRFYDAASGRLLMRIPVEGGARVPIDLHDELPRPWPAAVSIEQVLENGRRSARRYWPLD